MSAASDLLGDQQQFVKDLQTASNTMQTNASSAIMNARPAPVEYTPYTPPEAFTGSGAPTPPRFEPIGLDMPDGPTDMGELVGISDTNQDTPPVFKEVPPVLDFGTDPGPLPPFRGTYPRLNLDLSFPSPPSNLPPNPPVLGTNAPPTAPGVTAVSFDATAPTDGAEAPTDLEGTFSRGFGDTSQRLLTEVNSRLDIYLRTNYPEHHSQMARIEIQLTKYLDGGTGLKSEVEDAIYARAQAKNDVEAQRVQNSALADMAARGFTMPNGVGNSMMARARQEAANNNAKAANEIAIAQAEMEQKNLQFAVTTSAALRATAIQSMLSYMQNVASLNGLALEYAKGILGAVVQVYEAQVKEFALKLEAYKAAANVYDVKVRASGQVIEIYKAQIQAYEALTNVDRAKVDTYKARIDSMKSLNEMYKSQVDIVISKASLEKLKIDLFQAEVQTYSVEVQAKNAEWQGFQAKLSGQEAKAKIFASQVDGFNGEVAAYKAKTEGMSEKIKGETVKNNAVVQEFSARVSAYEAEVRAQTAVASGNIDNQRQLLTVYQGEVAHAVAEASMQLEAYKANVQASATNATTSAAVQLDNAKVGVQVMGALSNVYGEILKVYSGPASAAAAGMVALASINEDV